MAEEDLKLRGPGDLMGTQQSGALNLQLADLAKDDQILQLARNAAAQILKVDPYLEFPAHQNIKEAFTRFMKSRPNWSRIS